MGMQKFIKIYQKVQGIGPVPPFSEFEPRQNLDLSQIPFDNLIGYILSISMCLQNFIIILFTVLEIGPFSLFQNLELGKASTDDKCRFAILWARSFQHQIVCKFYQNIPNGLRVRFHCFQNLNLGKTLTNPKCHLTISRATSCQYTNVYAKVHHNIPLSWRGRAIFTFSEFGARRNLDRWKMTFHNLLG